MARHPKNLTAHKTLDTLARDPRILEVRDEGEDGLWADLAPGFHREGCIALHEYSVKALIAALAEVEEGYVE